MVKKCTKCGNISSKCNFQKNEIMSDGSHPQCISCRKKYYKENLVKIKIYNLDNRDRKKEYYLKNRDKTSIRHKEYFKNSLKTDVIFRSQQKT